MNAAADVTAIVPTFNRCEFLPECLDSLLGQTLPPRQIILIDDGSTDATPDVAARYAGRVEYLRQSNGGKSSALNRAMAQATGAAIWIFDDDDVAEPDALERLCAALEAAPDAGFSFGDYDNFTDDIAGVRRFTPAPPPPFELADLHLALLERCFVFQPAMLVRRRCYDAVGPFDTSFARAQDYEMLLRLSRHARAAYVPAVLFHQRRHDGARGTAALALQGDAAWERQKRFDGLVLASVYRDSSLADYLPAGSRGEALTPGGEIRARLRRAAVMARRKLWHLAIADLETAAERANRHGVAAIAASDTAVLGRVFDEFGYARDELHAHNPLFRHLSTLPAGAFRSALRAALAWPVFRYAMHELARGHARVGGRYLALYVQLSDAATLPRHLARLGGRVGARLRGWQPRHAG